MVRQGVRYDKMPDAWKSDSNLKEWYEPMRRVERTSSEEVLSLPTPYHSSTEEVESYQPRRKPCLAIPSE
jgi:hypothetical protein